MFYRAYRPRKACLLCNSLLLPSLYFLRSKSNKNLGFNVRLRSTFSLLRFAYGRVSINKFRQTRPCVSSSRLANQHYLSACFLGRCCIGHVSQSPMALGRDRKIRFSSFAQTIDTMHSLRRVAYFASDSLMNPNPLRSFLSEKEVHSISQSIVVFPADLK